MNRNFNFVGTIVLLAIFVGVLVGVGAYKYTGSSSVSLLSCEDSGFGKKCEVPSIDPAMVALQDAVLRDSRSKKDDLTGDYFLSFQGPEPLKINLTVRKGEYTLMTIKNEFLRRFTVIEVGMNGEIVSGVERSFNDKELNDRFYIPATETEPVGKGVQHKQYYEQQLVRLKDETYEHFGISSNKYGIRSSP